MSASQQQFKRALASWPSGVTLVTSSRGTQPVGMTVSAFFSASLDPLLIGVCLDNKSNTLQAIAECKNFGVNVLAEGQSALSTKFATPGNEDARFDELPLHIEPGNQSPMVAGAIVMMDCGLHSIQPAGDHSLCLGRPRWIHSEERPPLVFHAWQYRKLAPQAGAE